MAAKLPSQRVKELLPKAEESSSSDESGKEADSSDEESGEENDEQSAQKKIEELQRQLKALKKQTKAPKSTKKAKKKTKSKPVPESSPPVQQKVHSYSDEIVISPELKARAKVHLIKGIVRGYVRRSTKKKSQEQTLDSQKEMIANYAKNNLMTVTFYVDDGISGAKGLDKRPELKRLIDELQPGDEVVCANQSRLSRDTSQSFAILEMIEKLKKAKFVDLQNLNPDAYGFSRTFRIVTSDSERKAISERTKQKMALMVANKSLRGRPPFGLKCVGKDKPYVPDEEELAIVDIIYEMKQKYPTKSLSELGRALDSQGYKIRKCQRAYPNVIKRIMVLYDMIPADNINTVRTDPSPQRLNN